MNEFILNITQSLSEDKIKRFKKYFGDKNGKLNELEEKSSVIKSEGMDDVLDFFDIDLLECTIKEFFPELESILSKKAVLFEIPEIIDDKLNSIFKDFEQYEINNDRKPLIIIDDEFDTKPFQGSAIIDKLGCYFPVYNIIFIFKDRIVNSVKDHVTFGKLFWTVFFHEIGHWISHESLVKHKHWDDKNYISKSKEIHEFWAQIIAYYLMGKTEKEYQINFSDYQPKEYQNFTDYLNAKPNDIFLLLEYREIDNWTDLQTRLKGL